MACETFLSVRDVNNYDFKSIVKTTINNYDFKTILKMTWTWREKVDYGDIIKWCLFFLLNFK